MFLTPEPSLHLLCKFFSSVFQFFPLLVFSESALMASGHLLSTLQTWKIPTYKLSYLCPSYGVSQYTLVFRAHVYLRKQKGDSCAG